MRVILAGFGNVGGAVIEILADLSRQQRLPVNVVGVAELGGGAAADEGLDLMQLSAARRSRLPLALLPVTGSRDWSVSRLLDALDADCLIEATPADPDAGVARTIASRAIARSLDLILANKAPLAADFAHFADRTSWKLGSPATELPLMRFNATIAGALPLAALLSVSADTGIERVEGVLNGTSHLLLRLAGRGVDWESALAEAQTKGMAETDSSLDVEGHDAAAKLVILANAGLRHRCSMSDVSIEGIGPAAAARLAECRRRGRVLVPLAEARRRSGGWSLEVGPREIELSHPLARLGDYDMGVVVRGGRVPRLVASSTEPDAGPAAATVVRDLLEVAAIRSALGPIRS